MKTKMAADPKSTYRFQVSRDRKVSAFLNDFLKRSPEHGYFNMTGKEYDRALEVLGQQNQKDLASVLKNNTELVEKPKVQHPGGGSGGGISLTHPPSDDRLSRVNDSKSLSVELTTFVNYFSQFAEQISDNLDHEGL